MEILFIDLGVQATVEVTDLREIPPPVIQDLVVIPPLVSRGQHRLDHGTAGASAKHLHFGLFRCCRCRPLQATKCRLAELPVPEGDWTPDAVQMVKEALLDSENCKMKVIFCCDVEKKQKQRRKKRNKKKR